MLGVPKDDEPYELVEYACHESNYGFQNILSGAQKKAASVEKGPPMRRTPS
jgi:hypothetical protein